MLRAIRVAGLISFGFLCGIAGAALGQTQPDPSLLQKIIGPLQQQRNGALDALALAEAQKATLQDEVEKLKAEIAASKKAADQPK